MPTAYEAAVGVVLSLTSDQIARVQHLVAIDASMRTIRGDTVGEWMVAGNGSAVTLGGGASGFPDPGGDAGLCDAGAAGWDLSEDVAPWLSWWRCSSFHLSLPE